MAGGTANWRTELVTAVEGTPRFFIALFIVLEAGLAAMIATVRTPEFQLLAGGGMVLIAGLMILVAARNYDPGSGAAGVAGPESIHPLWGPGSLPLESEHVSILTGKWHAEWRARTASGALEPYVDDTITVTAVDQRTGELEALATSSYDGAAFYEVKGRVSKSGVAHLYYQFPAPHDSKVGMAILDVSFVRKRAEGWWMGGGRGDDRMAGGLTTWTKAEIDDRDWADRRYEFAPA